MERREPLPKHFADTGFRGSRPQRAALNREEMPYMAPTQRDRAVTAPAATSMTAVVNSIDGIRTRERPLAEPTRRGRPSGNGRCLRWRPAPRDAAIKTFGNT